MADEIHDLLSRREHSDPHSVLGLQKLGENRKLVRIWRPSTDTCNIEVRGESLQAKKVHDSGLYECEVPLDLSPTDYRLVHSDGTLFHDPYAFEKTFGELDVHLLKKGLHYELYNLLGATIKEHQGILGVNFAVWAPNAASVSLIGDFNNWDGLAHPMRGIGDTGVWEIFMPGLSGGVKYKFEVVTKSGEKKIKSDPVAHFAEIRPMTSSIVYDVNSYEWTDQKWFETRKKYRHKRAPVSIYEVHLGSWQREGGEFLNYRTMAARLVNYCKEMHFTHVELMGICEHPLDESWGYQVTGYFAPTSRYGTPEDFQYFVNYLHENEIGVILDFVPAHFPIDGHSLAEMDGTCLYEHFDPRQGFHPKWNTNIFNYNRYEVSNFLIASALFWLEKMHLDAIRVDAVDSMLHLDFGRKPGDWIPNKMGTNINLEAIEFLKHMNSILHKLHPDVLVFAEDSSMFPGVTKPVEEGGLGFDYKWGLGWTTDSTAFFCSEFSERKGKLQKLLHLSEYIFDEKFTLIFSHDDVTHQRKSLYGKMPGNHEEKLAGVRLMLSFMYFFPGAKLLFMGCELGQETEWDVKAELPWEEKNGPLQKMVAALNELYRNNPALQSMEKETFEWVDMGEDILAFSRQGSQQKLLCVHNFLPEKKEKITLPLQTRREIFNTDSPQWGGSGILNAGDSISLAPLATHVFEI